MSRLERNCVAQTLLSARGAKRRSALDDSEWIRIAFGDAQTRVSAPHQAGLGRPPLQRSPRCDDRVRHDQADDEGDGDEGDGEGGRHAVDDVLLEE